MIAGLDDIYNALGIQRDKLGCIMLSTKPLKVSDIINTDDLYTSKDDDKFWIDGVVSEDVPHVTLLFGLMQSGSDWKPYVDKLLEGWACPTIEIDNVSYFDSPYETENYYCIVAKLVVAPELLDANSRLRNLPHIDNFSQYTPHLTLAYIKKDDTLRDEILYALNNRFAGTKVNTTELDYGH